MTIGEAEPATDGIEASDSAETVFVPGSPLRRKRRGPRHPMRRGITERITASMVVGVVLALLAFVLMAAVLRDRRETTSGLVPTQRIPAGASITPEMVDTVEFPASVPFADGLVTADALDDGLVAGRSLEPGEPVTRSAVGRGAARPAGRVMSIPIGSWGDVGGELVVGDQIDVIDTRDAPAYVVQGAAVVERASGDGSAGGLSVADRLWVSIEVTADEALEVAGVVEADEFVVVRSTGAETGEVPPEAPPITSVTTPTASSASASDGAGGREPGE